MPLEEKERESALKEENIKLIKFLLAIGAAGAKEPLVLLTRTVSGTFFKSWRKACICFIILQEIAIHGINHANLTYNCLLSAAGTLLNKLFSRYLSKCSLPNLSLGRY